MAEPPRGLEQQLDQSLSYRLALSGTPDAPSLAGHYTGSETLRARVWPGGSYPTVATLVAAWDTSVAGNPATLDSPVVLLTVSASAVATLAPGTYQVEVVADPGVADELLWAGPLKLTPAPGSTALPRMYATLADMLAECGWLERVEGLADGRAAGFLPELAQASRWAEEQAMARWGRDSDALRRLRGPRRIADPLAWVMLPIATAWEPGLIWDTTIRDARATFSGLLDSAGLMANYGPDRGRLARLVALRAIYLALDDQVGSMGVNRDGSGGTPYQALAGNYRSRSIRALMATTFWVDSDADGVPDYQLTP